MKKLRTLADVLHQAGFAHITGVFLVFFLLCSTAVWLSEPTTLTFGDGLWFSFETVSTIGFGDIPAETPVARAITVILSVISIFYIAMLTGVAVSYCNTLIKLRQKDTMARFMDDLEHLEELDRDELADLSRRVREYRRRQRSGVSACGAGARHMDWRSWSRAGVRRIQVGPDGRACR